jgi:Cu/Ag efflux pump CusA
VNTSTLMSLGISVGILVTNSIVVIEANCEAAGPRHRPAMPRCSVRPNRSLRFLPVR